MHGGWVSTGRNKIRCHLGFDSVIGSDISFRVSDWVDIFFFVREEERIVKLLPGNFAMSVTSSGRSKQETRTCELLVISCLRHVELFLASWRGGKPSAASIVTIHRPTRYFPTVHFTEVSSHQVSFKLSP